MLLFCKGRNDFLIVPLAASEDTWLVCARGFVVYLRQETAFQKARLVLLIVF